MITHAAAFRHLFDPAAARAAMARATGRHRLRVLDRALEAHAAGSAGTRRLAGNACLAAISDGGPPTPLVNTSIEVDFRWSDLGLCVELDGPGHARPRTRRADAARDRAPGAAGHEVMCVSSERPFPPPA